MESLKLIILGIVQGVTELLPISSSGHLLIVSRLLEIDTSSFLLTSFHLGTTIAIVIFFRETIFRNIFSKKKLLFYSKIILASIPAAITGALFEDVIANRLRMIWITALCLILLGIVMIVVEKKLHKETEVEQISWKQSILIGISQVLALIPGTSRSGITTITGILTGLNKYTALEFSFILGIPILFGSFVFEAIKNITQTTLNLPTYFAENMFSILIIVLVPFTVGYFSLILLKKFKKNNWLTIFGTYRIIFGVVLLLCEFLK